MDTVLIVDDDQFFRIWIGDFLRDKHLRVLSAQDAEMALKLLLGEAIDAVLMDIHLPEVDGLELLRQMKGHDPDLPIIMVTGSEALEDAVASLEQGAFDYFKKPFELPKLYAALSQAIERYHLSRERRRQLLQLERFERGVAELGAFTEQGMSGEVGFSLRALFEKAVQLLAAALQLEMVSFMVLHERTGELRIAQAVGLPQEVILQTRQKVGHGIAGWVAQKGEPLFVRDIRLHPFFQASAFSHRYSTGSFVSVPIKIQGRTIGILNGTNKLWGGELTEEDFALFKSFASSLALAIHLARLSRRPETASQPPVPTKAEPPPQATPRILVVEDEPLIREMVKDSLELRGYQVLIAKDGLEGLEKAKAEAPDLIVLDVMMPKLDGFEVARHLKGDPAFQRIPIILLSAKEHFEDCGADLYMHKPFNPFHLVNNVAKALKPGKRQGC